MNTQSTQSSVQVNKLSREVAGLFAIFLGILLFLSLGTFDGRDPWLNHVVSSADQVHNRAGLFGSYVSGFLFDFLGFAAWVVPSFFCVFGVRKILSNRPWEWWRWSGFISLTICLALAGAARDLHYTDFVQNFSPAHSLSTHGGGLVGHFLYTSLVGWLSLTGTSILWVFFLLASIQLVVGFSWLSMVATVATGIWQSFFVMVETVSQKYSSQAASNKEKFSLEVKQDKANNESLNFKSSYSNTSNSKNDSLGSSSLPPLATPKKKRGLFSFLSTKTEEPEWIDDFEKGMFGLGDPKNTLKPLSLEEQVQLQKSGSLILASGDAPKVEQGFQKTTNQDHDSPLGDLDIPISEVQKVELAQSPSGMKTFMQALKSPNKIALPPLQLIEAAPVSSSAMTRVALELKGKNLMTCLTDFGIQCELVGITPGPVVTMFELRPAPGVRVSRIANLNDDLALALKAVAVRVCAPIPGTDTVGIEIPNEIREIVCFKELVSSKVFQESQSLLTLALGKDTSGAPVVANLATMPHLLVAGATGAGKSVGINSILLSILLKARPEEVKLLLVDPKRVEMAIYADLPHLVHPVVTEMSMAKNALDWAIAEMERRYCDIAKAGVRNISDYNEKLNKLGNNRPTGLEDLEIMPYLVIVIDELADLMLVSAKEVETSIVRLGQLARAAGIHLILATQRPSVDVVTGLIKANFPCRIAFQVTSKHDSRTILDTVGAEHLLGRGDMLFKPSGGKFQRLHGAFVSDKNVNAIVDYWRAKQKPDYSLDFSCMAANENMSGFSGAGADDILGDPLYAEACDFIRQQDKVSISLIQRRFRIGFNKAARFVEQMEQDGIVTPADGAKPRMVMR